MLLKRTDEGLLLLKKIIQKDSLFGGAYLNMALLLSQSEKYQEAAPYFDKCIKLSPKEAYNYNNRGYNRFKLGDTEGGLKDINYSIKLNPTNSWAYKNRGIIYLAQEKKEKACAEFRKAIELGYTIEYGNEVAELMKKNCADNTSDTKTNLK